MNNDWIPEGFSRCISRYELKPDEGQPVDLNYFEYSTGPDDQFPGLSVCCTTAEGYELNDIILHGNETARLSDEELVYIIRSAQKRLTQRLCYQRLTAFARDPLGYTEEEVYGFWSQSLFQWVFAEDYEIAKSMAESGVEQWISLLNEFSPYWECENPEAGIIYCLDDRQGHYKLGRTKHLNQRITQLRTQPPFDLEVKFYFKVIHAARYESRLHTTYHSKRLRGEWFALTGEDLEQIKRVAGIHEKPGR